ncbi:XkdX family protein [Levilactobacillus sp. N40-8-2]
MNFFTSMIIQLYKQGTYSDKDLPDFVTCGWLTTDQYKELTGKDYVAAT